MCPTKSATFLLLRRAPPELTRHSTFSSPISRVRDRRVLLCSTACAGRLTTWSMICTGLVHACGLATVCCDTNSVYWLSGSPVQNPSLEIHCVSPHCPSYPRPSRTRWNQDSTLSRTSRHIAEFTLNSCRSLTLVSSNIDCFTNTHTASRPTTLLQVILIIVTCCLVDT